MVYQTDGKKVYYPSMYLINKKEIRNKETKAHITNVFFLCMKYSLGAILSGQFIRNAQ